MKADLEIFTPFAKKDKTHDRITGNNCVVYSRVSSKEQERGWSIGTQNKENEEGCKRHGLNILTYFGGVYESAKTDERKEFNRMLSFARNAKEKVSYIVVSDVDRFSRSGANAIYIANELRKINIRILSIRQPSDTFTAGGKMQQNIQFIFAEYDNDIKREKIRENVKEMLISGYWVAKAPLGYTQITRRKRMNQDLPEKQITKVNETGKLLRKAFYWRIEGLSNVEILYKLKNLGLVVRPQKLSEIFSNPFYCGILSHNFLEGDVIEGKHEKLISKEVFLKANNIRSRVVTWKHNADFKDVPLKNFVKCGNCGTPFVGYMVKKKNLWYYKCNKLGCKCNRSAIKLNDLFIEKLLKKYSLMDKYIAPAKEQFIKCFNENAQESISQLGLLKVRLNDVLQKIEAIEERFAIGELEKELYLKFIGKYRKEKLDISTEISSLDIGKSNLEKQVEKYCQMLRNLPEIWASNSYKGKFELQELMFPKGITYDRENNDYRTPEINDVAFAIAEIAKGLGENDKGDLGKNYPKSPFVPGRGVEPLRLSTYAPQAYTSAISPPGHKFTKIKFLLNALILFDDMHNN